MTSGIGQRRTDSSVAEAIQRPPGETATLERIPVVTVSVEACGCPGGLVSLGLGQVPVSGKERLVDFLVSKEQV